VVHFYHEKRESSRVGKIINNRKSFSECFDLYKLYTTLLTIADNSAVHPAQWLKNDRSRIDLTGIHVVNEMIEIMKASVISGSETSLTPDQISSIISIISVDFRICAAYILGSAAQGRMRPESDVDIAVMVSPDRTFRDLDRIKLAAEISIEIGIPTDIGILSSANLVYAKEVYSKGIEIYINNRNYSDLMRATLLGMYLQFQEDRREVINAYRAR
jgi:uncharacterized protein